jgi:hypothetical protein
VRLSAILLGTVKRLSQNGIREKSLTKCYPESSSKPAAGGARGEARRARSAIFARGRGGGATRATGPAAGLELELGATASIRLRAMKAIEQPRQLAAKWQQ